MSQTRPPARRRASARRTDAEDSSRSGESRSGGNREASRSRSEDDDASDVRDTARQEARGTAKKARSEASAVADTAQEEATSVARTGLQSLQEQAGHYTDQLGERLYDARDELDLLLNGQPEQSGQVGDLLQQVADRLSTSADRVAEGGPQGLVDEARDLAGRRPGLFLLGAAVAGFGAGRLLRGARDADDDLMEQEGADDDDSSRGRGRQDRR